MSVSPFDMSDLPVTPSPDTEEQVRRSIFAAHVAYGSSLPDALTKAGYSSPSLHLGWTLLGYDDIRATIDKHRAYISGKVARNVSDLVEQLDRDREFAIETNNASVAMAATMAQAKLLGHIDPSVSIKGSQKRLVVSWGGDEADEGHI